MGNCLVSCCCCEHNCLIFPAPTSAKGWDFQPLTIEFSKQQNKQNKQIRVELKKFINQDSQNVPFIQISSQKSKSKSNKQVIIYFHGNAEDIFHSVDFVLPIFKSTEITILCLQYPTYSCYETKKKYFISDRIKTNSVEFHNFIQKTYNLQPDQIYIIGRSIGTGPASYLASQVQCPKLVLISPFDTIRKVAQGLVGCIGFMVKDHFSNEESILTHNGDLLVIHGMIDEVINFRHGESLVQLFKSEKNNRCTFVQPPRMSHNYFDINQDIVKPIRQFLFNQQPQTPGSQFRL